MSDTKARLDALVRNFVDQLLGFIGDEAKRSLDDTLGRIAPSSSAGKAPAVRRGRGEKRSQADLDALRASLLSYIKKNPGQRVEQINAQMGTTTKDLAGPIRKLIEDKEVKVSGQKRSTAYYTSDSEIPGSARRGRS